MQEKTTCSNTSFDEIELHMARLGDGDGTLFTGDSATMVVTMC